jgi:hypothetical protein
VTGAKRASRTGQHDAADAVVTSDCIKVSPQLDEHARRKRIEFVGSIQGEGGETRAIASDHE